jgi:hypothetical protein
VHRRSDEINSETSIEFKGLDISEDGGFLLVCFETEFTSKGSRARNVEGARLEYRCRFAPLACSFSVSLAVLVSVSHVLASSIGRGASSLEEDLTCVKSTCKLYSALIRQSGSTLGMLTTVAYLLKVKK